MTLINRALMAFGLPTCESALHLATVFYNPIASVCMAAPSPATARAGVVSDLIRLNHDDISGRRLMKILLCV
jgi:hypothetical protein